MRTLAWIASTLCAAGCAATAVEPPAAPLAAVTLANPGFEQVPAAAHCAAGWECSMHADPESFRFAVDATQAASGRASLCIERAKPEPWGVASQVVRGEAVKGQRVRFSLALRTVGTDGNGAGPTVNVHNMGGVIVANASRLTRGGHDWQRVAVELDVPADAYLLEVGALLEGPGRACVDDARLEILGAAAAKGHN